MMALRLRSEKKKKKKEMKLEISIPLFTNKREVVVDILFAFMLSLFLAHYFAPLGETFTRCFIKQVDAQKQKRCNQQIK